MAHAWQPSKGSFQSHLSGTNKGYFNSYQRDSGVPKHIVYGMFGCWQPAFEHQLVFVLHIKVPQFDSSTKHEEAMRDVFQACAMQHKQHVWHVIIDLHCSDRDGQRWQYWHQNTHGCNVMCKFMVNASSECKRLTFPHVGALGSSH